jgi:hypothetical protein
MPPASGARRNPARYLAPVALLAVVAGTYLIVEHGLNTQPAPRAAGSTLHITRKQRRFVRRRFYVVAPGDSLTAIAGRTGVPVGTIQALNPRIDPNSLQPGQRLRLRR